MIVKLKEEAVKAAKRNIGKSLIDPKTKDEGLIQEKSA